MKGICDLVRETSEKVSNKSQLVKINTEAVHKVVADFSKNPKQLEYVDWADCDFHYFDKNQPESVVDYIFIIDALNFCFWPHTWEYSDLGTSLKNILLKDKNAFKPANLIKITFEDFKRDFFLGIDFPLLQERHRIIQEVAHECIKSFGGEFSNIVKKANNSAQELVEIITKTFRNLQDHAIYDGEQTFFYKRAQILVADLWGAFKGESYGQFSDISKLTMFADYRVPQILLHLNVLEYSEDLKKKIADKVVLPHGGQEEVEIRANTVTAVEVLKAELAKINVLYNSVQIDWLLWQMGELEKDNILTHHRTLSIFY